tara:strand:- start:311 stop:553 length:243 start_codon:yes stop_codon:yes gene_type:complete
MWKRKPNRHWSVGMKTQDGSTITAIKRPPLVSREEGGAYHKGWWGGVVSTNPLWYDIHLSSGKVMKDRDVLPFVEVIDEM